MVEAAVNQFWIATDPEGNHAVVELESSPRKALELWELLRRNGCRVQVISTAMGKRILRRLDELPGTRAAPPVAPPTAAAMRSPAR